MINVISITKKITYDRRKTTLPYVIYIKNDKQRKDKSKRINYKKILYILQFLPLSPSLSLSLHFFLYQFLKCFNDINDHDNDAL